MEEAHYLAKLCSKVHVIHRRDEFRASKIMQERVMNDPKIEIHWNSAVDEILGEAEPVKRVNAIRLRDVHSNEKRDIPVSGVFIAIGHKPNSDLFKGVLDMDEVGYIKTVPGSTRTNVPGVFAAGDVADSIYRQAVTAAGTGCMAAIDAERFLSLEAHHE